MLVDSHCHLNFEAFTGDAEAVLARSKAKGMQLVVVGSQLATSQQAVALAQKHDHVWAAVGLHPTHVFKHDFDYKVYLKLATEPRVVALGETGLDYYRIPEGADLTEYKAKQKELFKHHWQIAKDTGRPLILHCRDAYDDLLALIRELGGSHPLPGVIHCFIGTPKQAVQFMELGFYVGITGIVTFKNAGDVAEVAELVPLEKLLIETDAPYLTPVPNRGKRNEPIYVEHIAEKIAELKGISEEEVVLKTGNNAINLFKLSS